MRSFIILLILLGIAMNGAGATTENRPWNDPARPNSGTARLRTEFISADTRETAEKRDIAANPYYMSVMTEKSTIDSNGYFYKEIDVDYMWLDREIFMRVEGLPGFVLTVNGNMVGYSEDSRVPSELNISQYIRDGKNTISIQLVNTPGERLEATYDRLVPKAYIFSQPKIRIENYNIRFEPDSTGTHGIFDLEIVISNSYNSDEEVSVGFDVYSPKQLEHFDMRPVTVRGNGRDTVRFRQQIWRTPAYQWSDTNPGLYHGMLIVKRNNRATEYIPYKKGFGVTEYKDGKIQRNGREITIKAAQYNHAPDKKKTGEQLAVIKKHGFNTVCTDYPQPMWFYELCDAIGIYVIDQANINNGAEYGETDAVHSLSNNPTWVNTFVSRVQSMYQRAANHSCIIGWSIGGDVGNGFNMYRCYLMLKEIDGVRAVIFNGSEGQWNSDMSPIVTTDTENILQQATSKQSAKRK